MNILITGRLGSGKDTVAAMIPNVIRVSFAQPLKDVAKLLRINDIDSAERIMNQMFGRRKPIQMRAALKAMSQIPKNDDKDRLLLQTLGTDWARAYDADIWARGLKDSLHPDQAYVITDCRFPNEFRLFNDFIRIFVDTNKENRQTRIIARDGSWNEAADHHASEAYIDGFRDQCDYVLDNNGTLDDLVKQVETMKARWLH